MWRNIYQEASKSLHDVSIISSGLLDHAAQSSVAVGSHHREYARSQPNCQGHADWSSILREKKLKLSFRALIYIIFSLTNGWKCNSAEKYENLSDDKVKGVQYALTMRTPPGEMKMPLPIIEPTITVTPFNKLIFGFSSIVESSRSFFSGHPSISFKGTLWYSSDFVAMVVDLNNVSWSVVQGKISRN